MISVDANILVYALNEDMDEHPAASRFMRELADRDDVVVAEQALLELYLLVRNSSVFQRPFSEEEAVDVCMRYRQNPRWRLVECRTVMHAVWRDASRSGFGRRRIIDARLARTLRAAGVLEFATRNLEHFRGYGFKRLWDPINANAGT